jgi:hypothetical protein
MLSKTDYVSSLTGRVTDQLIDRLKKETKDRNQSGEAGWFNFYKSFYEASSPTLQLPINSDIDFDNSPALPESTALQNNLHELIITLIRLQAIAKDHEKELSQSETERLSLEARKAVEVFQGLPKNRSAPSAPEETSRNAIQSLEIKHQKRRGDLYFERARSFRHDLDLHKSAHMVSRSAYHINYEVAEVLKKQLIGVIDNPDLGLSTQAIKDSPLHINSAQKSALVKAGIITMADLCKSSQWDLIKISGIGSVTIEKIADWLEAKSIPALCRVSIHRIGMIDHGAYAVNSNLSNGIISSNFLIRLNTDQGFRWLLPSAIAPDTELHFPLKFYGDRTIMLRGNPVEVPEQETAFL